MMLLNINIIIIITISFIVIIIVIIILKKSLRDNYSRIAEICLYYIYVIIIKFYPTMNITKLIIKDGRQRGGEGSEGNQRRRHPRDPSSCRGRGQFK